MLYLETLKYYTKHLDLFYTYTHNFKCNGQIKCLHLVCVVDMFCHKQTMPKIIHLSALILINPIRLICVDSNETTLPRTLSTKQCSLAHVTFVNVGTEHWKYTPDVTICRLPGAKISESTTSSFRCNLIFKRQQSITLIHLPNLNLAPKIYGGMVIS